MNAVPGDDACFALWDKYDMLPNYMSSADYTRFAQDTFGREKALIEKLGLAKGQ